MEMSKRTIIQIVICVGLLCLIWGGYFFANRAIKIDNNHQITLREDDFSWVCQVDSVKTEGKDFVLRGFAFELDKDATERDFEIVLHDIESGENYFPEMEYMERKDVNEYFSCEYDYLKSGFEASIKAKKLALQEKEYEVLLRVMGKKKAYRTGVYLSEGQLVYVNPQEHVPLEVKGTDLEKIVEEGVLRVYRPDYGMYVYQYEGELFWIADSSYDFDENSNTDVEYHLYTTQIDKLPEKRLENQWYWDNMRFHFRECELTAWDTGIYRVAKTRIPTEYSIKKVLIGNYNKEWIWQESFRPFYSFE